MSRKLVLAPVVLEASKSLSTAFTTTPTVIDFQDNVCYQIDITTSDSTGTFVVQVSLDYVQGDANNRAVAGNWIDLTMSGTPIAAAANDDIVISLNQLPYHAIRLKYTPTIAGTGTAKITIMAKNVGA